MRRADNSEDQVWRPVAEEEQPPPLPVWVKAIGALLAVFVLGFGLWIGVTLATMNPDTSADATKVAKELEPPLQLGDFVLGDVKSSPSPANPERSIVRASYSDGSKRLILLLSNPEADLDRYLADAGIVDTQAEQDGRCGKSEDTGLTVCALISDETAIAVVGMNDQSPSELAKLGAAFRDALAE